MYDPHEHMGFATGRSSARATGPHGPPRRGNPRHGPPRNGLPPGARNAPRPAVAELLAGGGDHGPGAVDVAAAAGEPVQSALYASGVY
jgi:hypothetical protein